RRRVTSRVSASFKRRGPPRAGRVPFGTATGALKLLRPRWHASTALAADPRMRSMCLPRNVRAGAREGYRMSVPSPRRPAPPGEARPDPVASASAAAPPPIVARPQSMVPPAMRRYLSLDDFARAARRVLPKMLWGYVSGGVESDAGVRDNRRAFDEYGFVPRVLNDVSGRDPTTTLFRKTYAAPFGIPPVGSAPPRAHPGRLRP